jgi:hypothetical protein
MIALKGENLSTTPLAVIEFESPYCVTDYMTKLMDLKENGEDYLIDNDKGWNTISQQVSKYAKIFQSVIVLMDQKSWCCIDSNFGVDVLYLHGPISGVSKGLYGLTAREAIVFAVWRKFNILQRIPPDSQWPVPQMAIYEPANKFNKDLPIFNGESRKFTPKASNRPGLRNRSGQGTRTHTLVRQTDGLPLSLDHDGGQPKRTRLSLGSTIEIELIEELKADVWLCCLRDSTDFLIAKRMTEEDTELESYLKLADFQGDSIPHCYGKWILTPEDEVGEEGKGEERGEEKGDEKGDEKGEEKGEEKDEEAAYLLLEYLEGIPFSGVKRFSLQARVSLWKDLSGLIWTLEGRGMIHRDIKPDNLILFLTPDLTCKGILIDFDRTYMYVHSYLLFLYNKLTLKQSRSRRREEGRDYEIPYEN